MTDKKEIIIDGVDVSKCGHYHYGKCEINYDEWNNEIIRYNECQNNPNCYFKQLKRKEQECEKLKEELQAQRDFTAHEQKLIYCVAYDESCKTGNDCKQKKCIFKDNIKLKQTLAEIKPIIEFYANSNMGEEQPDKTYHIMLNGSYIMVYDPKPARQALQKISEVK